MKRITAFLLIVLALTSYGHRATAAQEGRFDLLIRNGRVVDGTGAPWYRADVAIRDGRIAAIGRLVDARATRQLKAAQVALADRRDTRHIESAVRAFAGRRAVGLHIPRFVQRRAFYCRGAVAARCDNVAFVSDGQ